MARITRGPLLGVPPATPRRTPEDSPAPTLGSPRGRSYLWSMQTETWHSPVGLTHDAGWELDVRRTLPAPPSEIWQRLLAEWLPQWLGVESVPQMVGAPVRRGGRVHGRVIGCHVGRRVRLRWTPDTLDHLSLIHISEPTDRTRSRMPSSA